MEVTVKAGFKMLTKGAESILSDAMKQVAHHVSIGRVAPHPDEIRAAVLLAMGPVGEERLRALGVGQGIIVTTSKPDPDSKINIRARFEGERWGVLEHVDIPSGAARSFALNGRRVTTPTRRVTATALLVMAGADREQRGSGSLLVGREGAEWAELAFGPDETTDDTFEVEHDDNIRVKVSTPCAVTLSLDGKPIGSGCVAPRDVIEFEVTSEGADDVARPMSVAEWAEKHRGRPHMLDILADHYDYQRAEETAERIRRTAVAALTAKPHTNAEAIRNGADEGDLMARWFATSQHPERVPAAPEPPEPLTLHEAWARLADTPAGCTEPELFEALVTEDVFYQLVASPVGPGLSGRPEGGFVVARFDRGRAEVAERCGAAMVAMRERPAERPWSATSTVRDHVRDLMRDDPYAKKAVDRLNSFMLAAYGRDPDDVTVERSPDGGLSVSVLVVPDTEER